MQKRFGSTHIMKYITYILGRLIMCATIALYFIYYKNNHVEMRFEYITFVLLLLFYIMEIVILILLPIYPNKSL